MADSLISIDTSPYDREMAAHNFKVFQKIFEHSLDIRRIGAASLDLAYVACGRLDGYIERNLKPWDFAAGALILEEAGGKITNYQGRPVWEYSAHVGYLDIYMAQKDAAKCMETLEKLLVSAFKPWDCDRSPLYSHIKKKNNDSGDNIGEAIVPRILKDIEDSDAHEYDFLRSAPEFPQFMSRLKGRLERMHAE